jgi:hypothetical protein
LTYVLLFNSALLFPALTCADDVSKIDFRNDIRPILSDRCFHCHGPDAENQQSAFRMDTEEELFNAVEPGDIENSELHRRIFSDDPDEVMPPPGSNRSLSDQEKRTLELWIEQGAPYEGHWAFEVPQRAVVPNLQNDNRIKALGWNRQQIDRWSRNPIDAFIARRLAEEGLTPSKPADSATLLRRASMTLTGMLPERELQASIDSPNEIGDPYNKAVDSMLDSIAYAERQTLRWLDAAR